MFEVTLVFTLTDACCKFPLSACVCVHGRIFVLIKRCFYDSLSFPKATINCTGPLWRLCRGRREKKPSAMELFRVPTDTKYLNMTQNVCDINMEMFPPLTSHLLLDPIVLFGRLDGDEVHAPLPAVVPGVEPVPLCATQSLIVAVPRHPI